VISLLSIGPKVHGFKPSRGECTLMAIKIRSMTSFGGEVKPLVPCYKILWHVKETYKYEKRSVIGKIHGHFLWILVLCY
jgi:hypothetical protein